MSTNLRNSPIQVDNDTPLLGQIREMDQTLNPHVTVQVRLALYLVSFVRRADVETQLVQTRGVLFLVLNVNLLDVQQQDLIHLVYNALADRTTP